jgi:hypothetical protein
MAAIRTRRLVLTSLIVAAAGWPGEIQASAEPAADKAVVIGQPTGLQILPKEITLGDGRALQQILVTGQYADGQVRDLTPVAEFSFETADVATIDTAGMMRPKKDGTTVLVVKAGAQTTKVPITVKDIGRPRPVSFRQDLIAAINVGGCNAGACHGTPSGKGGFRLSLRGYDPEADFVQLTRDALGRRTGALTPDQSLILQKALGRIPHEGGQRFPANSAPHQVLAGWIAGGLQDDPKNLPAIQKVEVLPGDRVQVYPARWQQLAVRASLADGSQRDVTLLSVYTSSDPAVAEVSRSGLVEFKSPGETAILVRYLDNMLTIRLTYLKPREQFTWSNPPEHNYVDKLVDQKLKMLNILPSTLCSDQEFLRRAYMDVCGVLPTGEEAKAFLASTDPAKRAKLIDQLLERPEYADFWTLKWSDVFRSNRKTIQLAGVHKFQEWLRNNLRDNRPFDDMVREIITAGGSTYANPPANYYRVARDPTNLAETTAQLFFGIRMQCCKCHNHPFERWTQDDYYSLAAFFARVKQKRDPDEDRVAQGAPPAGAELIFLDRSGEVTQPRTNKQMPPRFLGGTVPSIPPEQDRREILAAWLTGPENTFFTRATVNRIWYHLLGRGIVDPVDDFRDSNPASNEDLLNALAKDFVDHKFDVKHIIRTVMNSRTYQLSAATNETNKDDVRYFSHAVTRLHTAEQLLDAICAATAVPEKFAGLPAGTRATQLPDGEVNHVFLKTFGQPARELACECERENDSNLAQALQLINGPTIHEKLRNPNNRIGQLLNAKKTEAEIIQELYLNTLSRTPNEAEIKAVTDHVAKGQDKRKAWEDVQWALINSKEFLFRH